MIINVKKIKIYTIIGVLEKEKIDKQELSCSFSFSTKFNNVDNINNTFSYASIKDDIDSFIDNTSFDLIESFCNHIIKSFLYKYDLLDSVTLKVEKMCPPVNYDFDEISVENTMSRENVVVNLGSNLGNKEKNIQDAIIKIKEKYNVIKEMDIKETNPYGNKEMNMFYNKSIVVEVFDIFEFHCFLRTIESKKEGFWENREIDIDIVLSGEKIINTYDLTVPHYDLENRQFMVEDIYLLYKRGRHPISGISWFEMTKKWK